MTYTTSLDKLAKGTTFFITMVFIAIVIGQLFSIEDGEIAAAVITTFVLLIIYFGTFLFRPISYKLNDNELIIHRSISDIKINRNEIKHVEHLEKSALAWSWRVFGVGGLFGYWGKFTNSKLGSMTWYATRRNKAVLIEMISHKKIIITPNEPDKFVSDYNK